MSNSIDNKVVSLQFDNAAFERNVATTMASLANLKKSLEFANVKNGFAEVNAAASNFNLGSVGAAVEGISAKFLALSTIAITVLSNIANRAVDAGIAMAKSLTVGPLMQGFEEYEVNMNSIQTILANTAAAGTTLSDVTGALEELNAYADQTIYNFSEMARNIGTFTAAGVDLDVATGAIKGIANLAAISGSNSQQASTAMYQLSQAIASGTVKLMDWNSVVNAGMGGEVFQRALFESGKALQTIEGVAIDTTFDQWTAAGNSFRGSLEQGWITAEVLTNTLAGFTGDLTKAQILSMGYTEDQAAEILKMGEIGQDAATKVKTLTQLIGTVKEAIGSGWSKSFQIIFGDFEEARELFTGISDAVGVMVGDSADARNNMLQSWKNMGGRTLLIKGLQEAFQGLASIFEPIKNAFRDIFPETTVMQLLQLTSSFYNFAKSIEINVYTAQKIHAIFTGLFSVLQIGWEILKNAGSAFVELFNHFTDGGNGILEFGANLGYFFRDLNNKLVEGEGIKNFFEGLVEAIKDPGAFLDKLKQKFSEFFKNIDFGTVEGVFEAIIRIKDAILEALDGFDLTVFDGVADFFAGLFDGFDPEMSNSMDGGLERVGNRLNWLGKVFDKVRGALSKVGDVFGWFWDKIIGIKDRVVGAIDGIAEAFSGFGPALLEFFRSEDFDKVLELAKVAISGIFAGGFNKIATDGLQLDLTGGALTGLTDMFKGVTNTMPAVTNSLNSLSGTLSAMQTNLKADTLIKIATAIALLTASVTVLSMIDTEALLKAMSALAVGFGQLIGAMALISQVTTGPKSAASFGLISTGMIALAGAILILSIAVKILSTMSWEELGKGLAAVTGLLGGLVAAVNLMPDSGKMLTTGLAIISIAVAMNILAIAMKIFATMSWEDIGKGLTGVAGGLALITGAVNLMPADMAAKGVGLLFVAGAMVGLALAMKIFATMSWEDIGKGLTGVAGGLLLIAGAMNLMPVSMVLTGPALIAVAFALNIMAGALMLFASMSWSEMGRGIATMAATLAVLAIAVNLMTGAIGGAIAIGVVSLSLGLLAQVLKEFAGMKLKDIGKGLLGLAGVLAVIGVAAAAMSPIIVPLLALGGALLLLGAGLALFGLGASLAAGAFAVLAEAGSAGIAVLLELIDALILRLPALIAAFALGIAQLVLVLAEQAPPIIAAFVDIIGEVLQGIIELSPQLAETLIALIDVGLVAITEKGPDIIAAGFDLLMQFIAGIQENIGEITTAAADIIIEFLNSVAAKLPDIVTAAIDVLVAFVNGIADNIQKVIDAGASLIVNIISGIADNLDDIIAAGADLVVQFITSIGDAYLDVIAAGADMISDLITGIGQAAEDVVDAGVDTIISFIEGLADNALELANAAADVIVDFINGLAQAIDDHAEELRDAGWNLAMSIIDGITLGMASKVSSIAGQAGEVGEVIIKSAKSVLNAHSPSRVFMEIGEGIVDGLAIGMQDSTPAENVIKETANNVIDSMRRTLSNISDMAYGIGDINPVITPVLDLTNIQRDAKAISSFFDAATITPDVSYAQARTISTTAEALNTESDNDQPRIEEVTFVQNNYSPKALSTNDIYRKTQSLVAKTKLELSIP